MPDLRVRDCTILIVDDEPVNVAMLEELLRNAGFRSIETTTDPRDTVQLVDRADVDLVLLDLHMPGRTGLEVVSELRSHIPPDAYLPVLIVTASTSDEDKRAALGSGAQDFLSKPFDVAEMILRVTNLLETRVLHLEVEGHRRGLAARVQGHEGQQAAAAAEREAARDRIANVIAEHRLRMVFQPIVDLPDGRLIGAEALARFDADPPRTPDVWFAEATTVGLATELELAALTAALDAVEQLPDDCFIAINLSAEAATSPALVDVLPSHLFDRVVIELTEHDRVESYDRLSVALAPFRKAGLRLAVDDAGAGYSGLHHILRIRPDIIKLDLGLTHGIHEDPARRALAAALVGFGREIGSIILAEGVEAEDELRTLAQLGVGGAQGFYLARPGPLPLALERHPPTGAS